jgi:formiminoglutamate deiminase
MKPRTANLWFAHALTADGWQRDVRVVIEGRDIDRICPGSAAEMGDLRYEIALPGLPNLHSHSFQRAMAGLAETPGGPDKDDFWSWRELMYRLVAKLTPEDLATVAAMAFAEMLEAGFTRVGEFHYLHHDSDGADYGNPAEMAISLMHAAEETGVALTLLPVFYAHAGFGALPPRPEQRRFTCDLAGFAKLLQNAQDSLKQLPHAVLGVAPHSLRAVTPEQLAEVGRLLPAAPVHIHIAEQIAEVEACIAWSGARPVEWLLKHAPVDSRWCLVHATHVDGRELQEMASRDAVVGLCPITEANLGDGVFPAREFAALGGRYGIGSDSNVRIDATEELRLLEYGQRLTLRRRNAMAGHGFSTGRALFEAAHAGGAQALGMDGSGLSAGAPADIVAISAGPSGVPDQALDHWIFGPRRQEVQAVWRAGKLVVADGRHVHRDAIVSRFDKVVRRLAL